jgi:hypothetical protein
VGGGGDESWSLASGGMVGTVLDKVQLPSQLLGGLNET